MDKLIEKLELPDQAWDTPIAYAEKQTQKINELVEAYNKNKVESHPFFVKDEKRD